MHQLLFKNTFLLWLCICFSCGSQTPSQDTQVTNTNLMLGADRASTYLPLIEGKTIGIVANQTSRLQNPDMHLVDYLTEQKIQIKHVFAPEHGFRGKADAGELIKDGVDVKTGLSIISLYGKNKKPHANQLNDIDLVVFDIQDVGARFYTYISTLHYVMQACAELNIPVLVLDRPNPNGHYIDGPILEEKHKSFVGMHPVPVVHGMTIGEYAKMINGQGWLGKSLTCDLKVIPMENYNRKTPYNLPVKPSPNLPNATSITLYPSLCFFEGTPISAGRGTNKQFQQFGAPLLPKDVYKHQFTPQANEGAKYPKFKNELCWGLLLEDQEKMSKLNLQWLIDAYQAYPEKESFFNSFFTKLAGNTSLEQQIKSGKTAREIRISWLTDLKEYDTMRQKYLLY